MIRSHGTHASAPHTQSLLTLTRVWLCLETTLTFVSRETTLTFVYKSFARVWLCLETIFSCVRALSLHLSLSLSPSHSLPACLPACILPSVPCSLPPTHYPSLFSLSRPPQAYWLPASYARLPIHIFEAPIVNHPDFGSTGPRVRIAADRHTRKVCVCAPALQLPHWQLVALCNGRSMAAARRREGGPQMNAFQD
jgi:hypothetical protein